MKTITVDGVKYVSEADYKNAAKTSKQTKKQIVILQRGWVVVGDYSYDSKANECLLENAAVIRVWGTTKGLGELAENGPLTSTKLDKCPNVRFHPLTVIARMDVAEDKWN